MLVLEMFELGIQKSEQFFLPWPSPPNLPNDPLHLISCLGHQIQVEERSIYSIPVMCLASVKVKSSLDPAFPELNLLGEKDSVKDHEQS